MPSIEDQTSINAISARDADERAAQLHNGADAIELLHRAQVNGDHVLARAIARHAAECSRRNPTARSAWTAVIASFASHQLI